MSLDIQQLQKSLEPYLSKAIAATCVTQPADPVEYLALHLKHQLTLNETIYSERKEQQTKIDKERNEKEKLVNEAKERQREEQEKADATEAQKNQERNQKIQDIFNEYKQNVEKIQKEQDEIDPDEEEQDGNANAEGDEEEAGDAEEGGEGAAIDEDLQDEINDVRVQLIVSKRKIQQARASLRQLFDQGLIQPFREPLKANPDGTPVPPEEPSQQVFNALKALQVLFDRPKRDLKVFHPNGLRRYIPLKLENLLLQIDQYDPNQNQRRLKFRRAKQITLALDRDQLQKENAAAAIIADFVQFCCESRKLTKKLSTIKKQDMETIPEDESDPQTDSELEYEDSEDDQSEPKNEENGEEQGEDDEEDE